MPSPQMLTREQMEAEIAAGRGVHLGPSDKYPHGRTVVRAEDLPNESELAGDDPAKVRAAAELLQRRKEAIEAELAALARPRPTPPPPPKAEATPPSSEPRAEPRAEPAPPGRRDAPPEEAGRKGR